MDPDEIDRKRPSYLCEYCFEIPPRFWSEQCDDMPFPWGQYVRLQPYRRMQAAAAEGCHLCRILVRSADVHWLDEESLKKEPLTLWRATIDTHQGICLVIGDADISHTTFYRVPEPWTQLPALRIGDPVDNVAIMRTWLEDCKRNHTACSKKAGNFIPTRLLDLQSFKNGNDIKLVSMKHQDHSDLNHSPEYVALSHCWGPPELQPIKTTTGSLQDRMDRIRFAHLSKTFKDAVRMTKELGQRYLWIDSLCIIQDDKDDWAKEAALMANVYGNAYCTLAALSSENSTQGCRLVPNIQDTISDLLEFNGKDFYHRYSDFGDDDEDDYDPIDIHFGYSRVRIFDSEPADWYRQYGDDPYRHGTYGDLGAPLRDRGWTLQERELSRRNIHFAKDQLLWECRELKASAQLPWHHKKPEDDFEKMPLRNELTETRKAVAAKDRWYELMEDFSHRNLTYETDKLPALSGLARSYQAIFQGATYAAGLWSHHLPAALLWRSRGFGHRYPSYIAPTWSWASVQTAISYESQRLESRGPNIDDEDEERPADFDFGELKVVKVQSRPKQNDPYGALNAASLVLNGALLARLDSKPQWKEFKEYPHSGRKLVLTKDGATVGLLYPDTADEVTYAGKLFCLCIRNEPASSQITLPSTLYESKDVADESVGAGHEETKNTREGNSKVMGLVLEEDLDVENGYTRIGLARWVKKSLFADCKPGPITLL